MSRHSTGRRPVSLATACCVALALAAPGPTQAQQTDTTHADTATISGADSARTLKRVRVTARRVGVGELPEVHGHVVLTGLKTESIELRTIDANMSENVLRQTLGRIPGAVIAETQGSGFPTSGVAFRGLNASQSIEVNTRQDGYDIAADPFGYPEAYYLPPGDALDRIEVVRGAASLQFGPQFGGVVNYILKDGTPRSAPRLTLQQTVASFGTSDTYASVGGGSGGWTYYGFAQRRTQDGWRPNSDNRLAAGYAKIGYAPSDRLRATLAYSGLRNRIHMPGGLTDAQFASDPRASYRARNWLTSPWNVMAATLDAEIAPGVSLSSTTSALSAGRALVWRNEDGGAGALDTIDPATGQYVPREVGREAFHDVVNETRILVENPLMGRPNTLAAGIRLFGGWMTRQGGGEGTTGSNFDLSLVPGASYGYDLRYRTLNAAAYAENVFRPTGRLSIAPGIRLEMIRSSVRGHTDTTFSPQSRVRVIPLLGLGAQYALTGGTLYANVAQAYRPIDYSSLTPFASVSRIDPKLHDARGYTTDLGWRGALGDVVTFDASAFYMTYDGRIGLVTRTDPSGAVYTERTNVANSVHKGLEAYVETVPHSLGPAGSLSVFGSGAYVDARYVTGEFRGKRVEYAPRVVTRGGTTYALGSLSSTVQVSRVSRAYGDANNTVASTDAAVGVIPAYTVADWSGNLRVARYRIGFGVNNLTDARYFTRRTDEYPGPGIIPSPGRSAYLSLGLAF